MKNQAQVQKSTTLFGAKTVEMLQQVHADAMWVMENLGIGCKQPEMQAAFRQVEADGLAFLHEDRIYVTADLVSRCLASTPGVAQFFVPENSFFIGGTAPYIYDDKAGKGGVMPTADHVAQIAAIAEKNAIVAGMGRGVKLKDEVLQMNVMAEHCKKPLYFAVTSDAALEQAKKLHADRGDIMIVFCLTRPPPGGE